MLGPVNYRVKEVYGKEHVKYVQKEKEVYLLTVVAEAREVRLC